MGDQQYTMGISRDSFHKRRKTGGKLTKWRKKRKFELGRPPSTTKIGETRIHSVRTRRGHQSRSLRSVVSLTWSTMPQTMSLCALTPWGRVALSRSTLLPSASGTSSITVSSSARRRKGHHCREEEQPRYPQARSP